MPRSTAKRWLWVRRTMHGARGEPLPAAHKSLNTEPGSTEESWSGSPNRMSRTAPGNAASRRFMSGRSTIEHSSTTSASRRRSDLVSSRWMVPATGMKSASTGTLTRRSRSSSWVLTLPAGALPPCRSASPADTMRCGDAEICEQRYQARRERGLAGAGTAGDDAEPPLDGSSGRCHGRPVCGAAQHACQLSLRARAASRPRPGHAGARQVPTRLRTGGAGTGGRGPAPMAAVRRWAACHHPAGASASCRRHAPAAGSRAPAPAAPRHPRQVAVPRCPPAASRPRRAAGRYDQRDASRLPPPRTAPPPGRRPGRQRQCEEAVDVREHAGFREHLELVHGRHEPPPRKQASIASMQAREGRSRKTPLPAWWGACRAGRDRTRLPRGIRSRIRAAVSATCGAAR